MSIKVFTSKTCPPCQEVHELLKSFQGPDEIEIVDIDTDAGFEDFKKVIIEHGEGAVPSAFKDGQRCKVLLDEEKKSVKFECPGPECTDETAPASPETPDYTPGQD